MEPIKENELRGHAQRLREILNRRLELKYGDTLRLTTISTLNDRVFIGLEKTPCTIDVDGDRAESVICGVLADRGARRILCSFLEGWKKVGKGRFQFDKAAMTFFLEFKQGDRTAAKQLFRLEWDNWETGDLPKTAAYPHWQFDRWLTASDAEQLDQIRAYLTESGEAEVVFESAEHQIGAELGATFGRPDLGWFTRLHFPVIAPWATDPIRHADEDIRKTPSHRSMPKSAGELEDWVESSLRYLKSELVAYA